MTFDLAIFLAALGITTLEFVEASAIGLALYGDTHRPAAFLYVALGSIAVLIPTFVIGGLIGLLPAVYVRIVGGVLLLYFGLRLIKSARRSVLFVRRAKSGQVASGPSHEEQELAEKGLLFTGFSVGAIEAFEAAIVIVGLLPNSYNSTVYGFGSGLVAVVIGTYILRNQVRKLKQATMKEFVSALLLSFSTFWFSEVFMKTNDLYLIPLFVIFFAIVHTIANRGAQKSVEQDKIKPAT